MRYLDPKNDLTFKKIFGEHKDLLQSLLNAVLPLEGRMIESLEYLSPEQAPENPIAKNTIVDVKCQDNLGRTFIVEMQMLWTESFKARVLFNSGKAYVRQATRGFKYNRLQPVYALNFIDAIYQHDTEEFYHHYKIVEIGNPKEQIPGMEFVFIELPKFKPETISEKKMMVLWLKFLTQIQDGQEKIPQELEQEEETKKALEILRESSFTTEEMEVYDRYWDAISTERSLIGDKLEEGFQKGMEKGMQKGMKKGIERGMQEGIEKGIEKGMQEGIKETLSKMVKNMIASGLDKATILKITNISEEDFNEIKNENRK